MKEFNDKVGMVDERVFFQSLYTALEKPTDDPVMNYSYRYVKDIAGDNDGIVSVESSSWGNNHRKIEGRISHMDILDVRKKMIHGIDVPSIYIDIIKDLQERGF
jgi:triacylglycerol esterase/lipase EstA (alpha/beta hydrolase family)